MPRDCRSNIVFCCDMVSDVVSYMAIAVKTMPKLITSGNLPNLAYEFELQQTGFPSIAGVDEVGRGALAGPVTAAAVILDPGSIPDGIRDSKELSKKKREELFPAICRSALAVAVGQASVREIDEINILQASLLAMSRACLALSPRPDAYLIDGNQRPSLLPSDQTRTLVRGDQLSLSIAAASIVAKVTRDRIMIKYADYFSCYQFDRNKGYGTAKHRAALTQHGFSPLHRRSFRVKLPPAVY